MATPPKPSNTCEAAGCSKPASMQCPTCIKVGLPPTYFCSQDCFTKEWKSHNAVHKAKQEYRPPPFEYTGPLRPYYVTPMRSVPDHIVKPDWYLSGIPISEERSKQQAQIPIYDKAQIRGIRAACRLGREILDYVHSLVRPGITTDELDKMVHKAIIERGAYPSPLNYHHFPKSFCTSVNEVICHGIPDCRPLQDGDIINCDISVFYKGYHGDLNETYCVGNVDPKFKNLIRGTHDATMAAIKEVKPGTMIRDLGNAIQNYVSKHGYSVVKSYCGHGIGELFHCAPSIPHYGKNKAIGVLRPGMIFTIEPMINFGTWRDKTWPDDWTSVTVDGERSAQFEHQVLVTQNGVEILTARTKHSPPLWWEVDEKGNRTEDPFARGDDTKEELDGDDGTTQTNPPANGDVTTK